MDKSQEFRTEFAESIFNHKYKHENCETWAKLSKTLVNHVCEKHLSENEINELVNYHSEMKFIAGGRYLYYAGRESPFFNNCYLLKSSEDSREDWADLSWKAESCLMTGGGIGNDYSIYRAKGSIIHKTGGFASGPISKMKMINEIGREVMQGGSRRSAIYSSLNWLHSDIGEFLHCKDWYSMPVSGAYDENNNNLTVGLLKEKDFNYHAPLDMTNISLNYDNEFLEQIYMIPFDELKEIYRLGGKDAIFELPVKNIPLTFLENCRQALKTGEPGFSFNFFEKVLETLRNAPVVGSTKVLTSQGYLNVIDIINKPVTLWTGDQWVENVVFKLTIKDSDLVKVSLSNGRSIICNPDHPFIAKDYLGAGKTKKTIFSRIKSKELNTDQKIKSNLPSDKSYDFDLKQYGLGFIFGDGSISNGRGDISYHVPEKKVCFELSMIGLNAHVVSNENRAYFKYQIDNKSDLLNLGILHTSFIAGLFDADGCYTRQLLRLSNSDINNLYKVQESLDFYGIKSVVREDGHSSYKPENKSYTLNVLSDSLVTFKNKIPTYRLKIDLLDSFVPYRESEIRVINVEQLSYKEDVYCCDVGVDEHSFMAEGVVISNCCEVTSEDDSDVCNLASVNMANIEAIEEFKNVCYQVSKFLLCGTLEAELPYNKVYNTRAKNRRLGLGLMGVHEWLLKRGYRYEVTQELKDWLQVYKDYSEIGANELAEKLSINKPVAYRAIAPTGTIGILAGTTTGIEPLFAVAYKRRYLKGKKEWHYQYVIDGTAKILIDRYNIKPEDIETALSLSEDYERRIKFQADIQDYVDMSISSTINLPKWGTELNNDTRVNDFAHVLARYAVRLRGFTCYPDGARGGQPLNIVDYYEALKHEGQEFKEQFHDICEISSKGGTCGV